MSLKGVTYNESVSKNTLTIGGVRTYVYGLEQLKSLEAYSGDVAVLYMFHGRTDTHKLTEACAYYILSQLEKFSIPLLCVTFDMRNHGERVVDVTRNQSWSQGNTTHGMDMASIIDGSVQDAVMIMNYLPSYVPGYTFRNFATGISMGGHSCYRIAISAPDKFEGIIPILGCPDLTSLLLNRLLSRKAECQFYEKNYSELGMKADQLEKWPKSFHAYLSSQDREVADNLPLHIKVFALFGKEDKLVPVEFSKAALKTFEKDGNQVQIYTEPGTGHNTTEPMLNLVIDSLAKWLVV